MTAASAAATIYGSGKRLRPWTGARDQDGDFGRRSGPQDQDGGFGRRSDPTGRKAASAALRIRNRSAASVGGRFEGSVRRLRPQDRSDGSGKRLRPRTIARDQDGDFGRRSGPQDQDGGFGRRSDPTGRKAASAALRIRDRPATSVGGRFEGSVRRLRPQFGSGDQEGGFGRSPGSEIGGAASPLRFRSGSGARLHRRGSGPSGEKLMDGCLPGSAATPTPFT